MNSFLRMIKLWTFWNRRNFAAMLLELAPAVVAPVRNNV